MHSPWLSIDTFANKVKWIIFQHFSGLRGALGAPEPHPATCRRRTRRRSSCAGSASLESTGPAPTPNLRVAAETVRELRNSGCLVTRMHVNCLMVMSLIFHYLSYITDQFITADVRKGYTHKCEYKFANAVLFIEIWIKIKTTLNETE